MWQALVDLALKLFGLWLNKTPGPIAEAEKAGAAQAQLQAQEASKNDVQKSVDAGASVARSVSTDDGLRNVEASDPNNRDNA